MAVDEGFEIENDYFRMVHPKPSVSDTKFYGQPEDIIDYENDTRIEIRYKTMSIIEKHLFESFIIYPKHQAVRDVFIKCKMEGIFGMDWDGYITLWFLDADGNRTDVISASDARKEIDRVTFPINRQVSEMHLEFSLFLQSAQASLYFNEFDMMSMNASRLYGKNRTETVCFAERVGAAVPSRLLYQRDSNTVKNIYLVSPGDVLDSGFRVKVEGGRVLALAKFPQ